MYNTNKNITMAKDLDIGTGSTPEDARDSDNRISIPCCSYLSICIEETYSYEEFVAFSRRCMASISDPDEYMKVVIMFGLIFTELDYYEPNFIYISYQ